jgi:hypothetical protein
VDWANALTERISRPIGHIRMASIPEHDRSDYASLERLKLDEGTKLFLGLIHGSGGLVGARRRIEAASESRSDFGVAHFCGLNPPFGWTPTDWTRSSTCIGRSPWTAESATRRRNVD